MTKRTFSVRSNCIRNARLTFGKSAKEGTEFSVTGTKDGGFFWEPLVAVPSMEAKITKDIVDTFASFGTRIAAATAASHVKRSKLAKRAKPLAKVARKAATKNAKLARIEKKLAPFRHDTKTYTVLKSIAADGGGALQKLVAATGWQKHTIRGRISTWNHPPEGASYEPLNIKSYKDPVRGRVYQMK